MNIDGTTGDGGKEGEDGKKEWEFGKDGMDQVDVVVCLLL